MKKLNKVEAITLNKDMLTNFEILEDHRDALINERVFSVIRYNDTLCVLTVFDATDMCNVSESFTFDHDDTIEAYTSNDMSEVHDKFVSLIAERLKTI